MTPLIMIKRLRVMKGATPVYDESFHRGVNIIRGENSSGKSTIADFMFFALGGEFDRWKDAAQNCTSVRLEIETTNSTLTLHRSVGGKLEPIFVYYGSLEDSIERGIDEWHKLPIRRPAGGKELSISQVLFRASGIPEAPNSADSNITMHQIMRLLYADQQTPAGKLFRFESFDTRDIREAVGQLLIGINGYDLYEGQIRLRELKTQFAEKERLYRAALVGLPSSEGLASVATLDTRMSELSTLKERILHEISNVDVLVGSTQSEAFVSQRRTMQEKLRSHASLVNSGERRLLDLKDEIEEIDAFFGHLNEQMETLRSAENIAEALGHIEFQYCPSCLKTLQGSEAGHCIVCSQVVDEDVVKSKYFEIKIDTELQMRETSQLLKSKTLELDEVQGGLRALRREYSSAQSEFSARYDISNSPRETFLAERNRNLGRIDRETTYLEELRAVLERIDRLSHEKNDLNDKIALLEAQLNRLAAAASSRRLKALSSVSAIGRRLLKEDLPREDTFEDAKTFTVDFGDDAMLVDGKMNFAESSNVVLKNTAILSLFLAACYDSEFWHPRMLIMDNVEDKGMEPDRSHNFQRMIIRESQKAKLPHQIIFTTSMLAPELEKSPLTIGPKYTRQNKTLQEA
ncbi:hypothetical protein GR217_22855 [Rhizobium leguminosarum]|uniref:Rad50/SbcC-type AAA domain-containing protein n=1 Tax=Rhizobium ruizarguesonis TaxID=2081791 RepID=A0AAE4YUM9_9HYPH|nr:ATP-binding protein [Rhizobium ruizarguesonis]NEI50528.1 hypothetical protein [Rhizobium ruizarguesonis]